MRIFQPIISGSFTTSGSVFLKGLSSNAQTAVVLIDTGSGQLYFTSSAAIGGTNINTGSLVTTASFNAYTGSNTAQFAGTASYASVASTTITSQTASYATNFTVGSTLSLDGTLFDRATVNSTIVGSNNLFTQATGSFTAAFGKYTVRASTRSRAGEFWTVWNGTTVEFTDTSTVDVGGPTTPITFNSTIVGSNIQIDAVSTQSGWTVKMLITFI
jgi:hypothetical protein